MKSNLVTAASCLLAAIVAVGFAARPMLAAGQDQDNAPQKAEAAAPGQDQDSAPQKAEAPAPSKTQVESWTKPQPGWLYILDPEPGAGRTGGRVWLIEPENGKVMGSIATGTMADFALSPDGSRLYVASAVDGDASELAVIDTAQGVVLKSGIVNSRAMTDGLPPFSTMAVSGDGLAVRILIDAPKPDKDAFLYATFDTRAGEFAPGVVPLGNCGPGRFISHPAADHFDVLCPRSNKIRLIKVDADSRQLEHAEFVLPWERRVGAAAAIEVPGSQQINIVRGDGGVVAFDTSTQRFDGTAANPTLPNRVPPAAWPVSPDGSRLYLGYNTEYSRPDNRFYLDYGRAPNIRPSEATAGELHVLDTHTWKKIGTIKTKATVWSAVISRDGNTLYAMAPHKHSILVIDTQKMHETRAIKIGGAPALALVAP